MELAVSEWFPYRHQAAALQQLLPQCSFDVVPLDSGRHALLDASLGPFIALIDDDGGIPLLGISAIGEALDRRCPDAGVLGEGSAGRAQVRALAAMIDERISRLAIAAIPHHSSFGRPIWHAGSDAPRAVLDTPPPLETIEKQLSRTQTRFTTGGKPSLADALLAALWWTAEDLGATADLEEARWIAAWRERNCKGDPFTKA